MSTSEHQYRSSCHCHAVIVDFTADERLENREFVLCNCSICNKNGYINYYVSKENMNFVEGKSDLRVRDSQVPFCKLKKLMQTQEYSFAPHNRKHLFCSTCGTSMLIVSNEKIPDNGKIGVNMRSVEGLDVQKLKVRAVDGKARRPEDEMRAWEEAKTRDDTKN